MSSIRRLIYRLPLKTLLFFGVLIVVLHFTGCGDDQPGPSESAITFFNNPTEASIITSDIDLFWKVYDESNSNYSASIFRTSYFEAGTEALELFFTQKVKNASKLTNVLSDPGINKYYEAIRPNTENLNNATDDIYMAFNDLKALYDEAVFSDIVFVIGALSTGGTLVKNGQMVIGSEMFVKDDNTPLEGLPLWQSQVVRDKSFLVSIVIHELIHVQQANVNRSGNGILSKNTLLDKAVTEGVADFVTDIVLGKFFNQFIHDYGNPREKELWEEFELEMNGNQHNNWLYNFGSSTDRPGDLGYYIGYKVAEYFYDQQQDKITALKTILELESGKQLLAISKYDTKFD